MYWVTKRATVKCGHDGLVENVPGQSWVTVGGAPVLVTGDPPGRRVTGCPNIGPTVKPCTRTLAVAVGYSGWVRVDGRAVVLSNLDGLTDGTVPGTVHYTVRDPGQSYVSADS
ncbi:MAG TPA: hypothetical protein VJT31_16275 [Rugosimonospora sp.]|nr:hypothetical protein [Rugosimonospora sp.]